MVNNRIVVTHDDALKKCLEYFNGDTLAANVWINKYALKDSEGNLYEQSPEDMHKRIASEIARIEAKYPNGMKEDEIFYLLDRFKYIIPQGSPMAGIGNDFQISSISNCFVVGNDEKTDSYGGIMRTDEHLVQLSKRRAGVGGDLSHIRPKGMPVKNSALNSTGVIPYMERYSNSIREVAQDGRRGALMLSISIKHPDVEDFIDAKMEDGKVTGANISVKLTDDFMKAVVDDSDFTLQYPVDSENPKYTKIVKAKNIWNKIVHNANKSGEPGIMFWDTMIRESIPDCYKDFGFATISTNPCGEVPLNNDSCRLLAINLYSFVVNPFTPKAFFDFNLFKEYVYKAQKMMDDIVDLEIEKMDKILQKIESDPESDDIKSVEKNLWLKLKTNAIKGRRCGLGITAEGDMLAAMNLTYGSDEAIEFSKEVHKTMMLIAYRSSVDMARDRGKFEIYDSKLEVNNPMINRIKSFDLDLYNDMVVHGRRNIALLTAAPTGTLSIMTQTTSGIEPVFKVAYKRRKKINPNDKNIKVDFIDDMGDKFEEFYVFHHHFKTWLGINGYNVEDVMKYRGDELNEIIKKSPYFNATSDDINWINRVKTQAAIQQFICHSISSTVNLPSTATEELVSEIYKTAWQYGCKGITVYRDGSRSGILVDEKAGNKDYKVKEIAKRPKSIKCDVIRFKNNGENWVCFVGLMDDKPYEIFTGKLESFTIPNNVSIGLITKVKIKKTDDNGEEIKSRFDFEYFDADGYKVVMEGLSRAFDREYWNYGKLLSGLLRHKMDLSYIIKIISDLNMGENGDLIGSWKKGVIRILGRYIKDDKNGKVGEYEECPICHQKTVIRGTGCKQCINPECGHSQCGS